MGLFGFGKKNVENSGIAMPDFEQSMQKKAVALDKVFVSLDKKNGVNLSKHIAEVIAIIDYSYSMDSYYSNKAVERALERLLPIGIKFDDNKRIPTYLFTEKFYKMPDVTPKNCRGYLKANLPSSNKFSMGGTEYSPVLNEVLKEYKKSHVPGIPTYVMFLTDGACSRSDEERTDDVIRQMAEENIFVQFIGIGNNRFEYLHHLDDFKDRRCDNTGFTNSKIMGDVSDDELYTQLLEEYSKWVRDYVRK